jgi:seryl-tRNA synthetase
MLDLKDLKKNKGHYIQKFQERGFDFDVDMFDRLDSAYQQSRQELQSYQNQRNILSEQIGRAKSQGQDSSALHQQVLDLKNLMERSQASLALHEAAWENFWHRLPNCPDLRVPVGAGEEDNVVLKKVGDIRRLEGEDHTQILDKSGCLMSEAAADLSGARFSILKGPLARIHRALTQFMLSYHEQHGHYEEYYVPYAVHRSALFGTGQLPKFEEDLFHLDHERDLFLIPTAEVPLTNLMANRIHSTHALPLRMMAHTPCFRSEAGSYGRDVKGIFRQHQFDKIELVHGVTAEQSDAEFDFLVKHVSNMLSALELPHQWTLLCTKDLGAAASRTIDIEVWLPGQQKYREISSCSQFGDYQARRMKARHKAHPKAPTQYIHTINGSGVAVGRALIALIENHGTQEGCIIPLALRPFLEGRDFISWV